MLDLYPRYFMAIFIFIFSLLLFVFTIGYHLESSIKINNLNITKISNEQRYQHYLYFSRSERLLYREKAREMFQFGYDNYMKYAFPQDELDPINCRGRGPDIERPENYNINDVLGEFSLTLIDSLDTLAVMGNVSEFQQAVKLVIDHVRFDRNSTIQVFEATIRVLGALLSAHLLIIDPLQPFGNLTIEDYDNELLDLAHDLASRLLPAFENTPQGLPYPRVNLMTGLVDGSRNDTSTAGAGSLSLEFSILSRLVGDPVYEQVARRAVNSLWDKRNNVTGLLGSVIDVNSGEWLGQLSGLGAGIDSFFEYLLKNYILFGDEADLRMFDDAYRSVTQYMRRGRVNCMDEEGIHPIFVNVNMHTGQLATTWIDALQASFSAVQVLRGDIDEAICLHALYYSIWRKFGVLPERFNWQIKMPDVLFYPLRPEFIESTYFLYQATKNPFYLHVGRDILDNLNTYTKVECGFATVHDVRDKTLEDRMESFFLSETCKYLFLLFDEDNYLNQHGANHYIFTTEAHIIPLMAKLRRKIWDLNEMTSYVENTNDKQTYTHEHELINVNRDLIKVEKNIISIKKKRANQTSCQSRPISHRHQLPLSANLLYQVDEMVGVITSQP
ncbi:unnamed protein product [Rotaria sordida]|uniref:alpha-1,2-Mannosidase n=1 Tax=Rotaria sordida TaxID=392033 RepID=A0A814N7M4_9BILA|nr:unnamed protein product [Rotaria sordida]CAF0926975.1 unnamed protein product [Rotaria sordida]CAF1089544.1 unnamed protein product [Rotaria sordida]